LLISVPARHVLDDPAGRLDRPAYPIDTADMTGKRL
jgi:hypothetical protein